MPLRSIRGGVLKLQLKLNDFQTFPFDCSNLFCALSVGNVRTIYLYTVCNVRCRINTEKKSVLKMENFLNRSEFFFCQTRAKKEGPTVYVFCSTEFKYHCLNPFLSGARNALWWFVVTLCNFWNFNTRYYNSWPPHSILVYATAKNCTTGFFFVSRSKF